MRAFLALGSNIEPRRKYLQSAVSRLEAHPEVLVEARSRLFESPSVGSGGEGDFLNAALEIETSLAPRELLALCQSIESACGRAAPAAGEKRAGERTLDVDILCVGEEVSCAPDLLLPHPRALARPFVLMPLLDLLHRHPDAGWAQPSEVQWDSVDEREDDGEK